jgi:site-specific recombinase
VDPVIIMQWLAVAILIVLLIGVGVLVGFTLAIALRVAMIDREKRIRELDAERAKMHRDHGIGGQGYRSPDDLN